jgi:drug/metabolite transporter (DMT)-like permease
MLEQAIVCTICSAFLAKERPQWVWVAGLVVFAGVGGLLTLGAVHAQQLAWGAKKRAGGQLARGAR